MASLGRGRSCWKIMGKLSFRLDTGPLICIFLLNSSKVTERCPRVTLNSLVSSFRRMDNTTTSPGSLSLIRVTIWLFFETFRPSTLVIKSPESSPALSAAACGTTSLIGIPRGDLEPGPKMTPMTPPSLSIRRVFPLATPTLISWSSWNAASTQEPFSKSVKSLQRTEGNLSSSPSN